MSAEKKLKLSIVNKGKIITEDRRKKISLAKIGRKWTLEQRENYKANRKPLSEDAKRRIGEASKGRKSFLGRTHTLETRKKLSDLGNKNLHIFKKYQCMGPAAMAKSVRCVDDGNVFESASAAARFYNVTKTAVIGVCNKKKYRKTAGGLRFEYLGAA